MLLNIIHYYSFLLIIIHYCSLLFIRVLSQEESSGRSASARASQRAAEVPRERWRGARGPHGARALRIPAGRDDSHRPGRALHVREAEKNERASALRNRMKY